MHLTIATAGHIDHGKSALIQALTGTNPDRLPEEQARGISIELGFAHTRAGDVDLSFIDVPGHERFVRTMLGGVGGIDAVLLVVAADESVMPQTREHLAICRLLDVPAGAIALTKCDVADETMQAIAEDDVRALVAGTALAGSEIVRVSARTGHGVDRLRDALVRCVGARRARDLDAAPRLPIDRVFTMKGFGTVVTGTLWSGTVSIDQSLGLVSPAWRGDRTVRVRGLQVHGEAVRRAEAGQRVAINLANVAHEEVQRGDVLVGPGAVLSSRLLEVDVDVLPDAPPQRHNTRVHVHLGTTVVIGRLLLPERDGGATVPRAIQGGARARGWLRLEAPIAARRGDRLVLRAYSPLATVAGALIADPRPSSRHLSSSSDSDDTGDITAWLLARIEETKGRGLADADVPARCGVSPAAAAALAGGLESRGAIARVGPYWVSTRVVATAVEQLLATIGVARAADPFAGGVPRATLRAALTRSFRPEVVDHVLAQLVGSGRVSGEDRLSSASAAGGAVSDEVDEAAARVRHLAEGAGLKGVTLQELEGMQSTPDRRALQAVLARLVKAGALERVGDAYIPVRDLQALVQSLRELSGAATAPVIVEVGWFKERFGLTRKTAIPLLEWLDRTRVTRRQGDTRVLLGTS